MFSYALEAPPRRSDPNIPARASRTAGPGSVSCERLPTPVSERTSPGEEFSQNEGMSIIEAHRGAVFALLSAYSSRRFLLHSSRPTPVPHVPASVVRVLVAPSSPSPCPRLPRPSVVQYFTVDQAASICAIRMMLFRDASFPSPKNLAGHVEFCRITDTRDGYRTSTRRSILKQHLLLCLGVLRDLISGLILS